MRIEQPQVDITRQSTPESFELRPGMYPLEGEDYDMYESMSFDERKQYAKMRAQYILLTKYIGLISDKAGGFVDGDKALDLYAKAFNDYLVTHEDFRSAVFKYVGDLSVLPEDVIEDMVVYLVSHPETKEVMAENDKYIKRFTEGGQTH
jgi:hypothetical protein